MKKMETLFSLLVLLLLGIPVVSLAEPSPFPIRGLHLNAPVPADMDLFVKFIEEALPREGANLLVMEINYKYKFSQRPEVVDPEALSREELQRIAAACRKANVQLVPMINCLGHQSWAKTTFGLLRSHPEFDETPGKYPQNEGIYCRSYCPLHPQVHEVMLDLIDELAEVCEAKAFHVGMDEVFLLGEEDCPRCRGKNKAELLAGEVTRLRNHLAQSGRTLWIWGDRLLDGNNTGLGKWEASQNQTAPAIGLVPKDIVICDWHYERAEPTPALFALAGFPVVVCPWREVGVALGSLEFLRHLALNANPVLAGRAQGVLQTTWCNSGDFIRAYQQGTNQPVSNLEAAYCFKALFAELRKNGNR